MTFPKAYENEPTNPELPEYLPTCKFEPPYCSVYWTEEDWKRTIALQCPCEAHKAWRAQNPESLAR